MKKIKSENKFHDDIFKIKIGTIDKKNPEVVYIELGSYISPLSSMENYTQSIEKINKSTKTFLNSLFLGSKLCEDDFIFISDVADKRITKGKKSYMEMQIYIKPKTELRCKKFSEITERLNNDCISKIIPIIKENINKNGFECYKTRK